MSADRSILIGWIGSLAAAIVTDGADLAEIADRSLVASGLDAGSFAGEAVDLMRIVAENAKSVEDFERIAGPLGAQGADTISAGAILMSVGLSLSAGRIAWPSRPAARQGRRRIEATAVDALAAVEAMGGAGADLYGWLSGLITTACRLVSDIAATTSPMIRVETGMSMPSTVLAYQLYGDARRAAGLVDLAGSATPMVMPVAFDALAT